MRPRHRRFPFIGIAVLALLASSIAPAAAVGGSADAKAGGKGLARNSWIVLLAKGSHPSALAPTLAQAVGGRVGHVYTHAVNGFQFKGSAAAAAALETNSHVISVQKDREIRLTETLPFGVKRVFAYRQNGQIGAYQAGFRGNGARIAIVDTGIDLDHPELAASIDNAWGKNCITTGAAPNDGHGHGSHVAGTAAAPINGVGGVGIAPQARLVAVKMFTDAGTSSEAAALCALDHIVALNQDADATNDVDVANMSWGEQRSWGDCATDALHGAICSAYAAGIILVAGAGNSSTNGGTFVPAAFPEVISVSALADFDGNPGGTAGCGLVQDLLAQECDDTFAFFSNNGPSVDVIAPGVNVYSSWANGTWRMSSGTSMATPHVAGIAALMAAAAPGLTPDAARSALLASGECPNGTVANADDVPGCASQGTWRDDSDGIAEPLANALRAAQLVTAPPPVPVPPAAPTLSASASTASIDLTWNQPADGGAQITSYEVYRGATGGSATLYETVTGATSFTDLSVSVGETWWYQVAAVNSAGLGPRSNEVSATVPEPPPPADPPGAPALTASAGDKSVTLSWTAPSDDGGGQITNYEIYRSTSSGQEVLVATVGTVLTWKNTGLTNGTTYWYQVAAVNEAGPGARSNEVSAKPTAPPTAPSPPRSLKAQKVGEDIRLTWLAPSSTGGSPVTHYRVYRTGGSGGAVVVVIPVPTLTFTDTTVAPSTWYAYIVTAVNGVGESNASNIVAIKSPS
jgi:subtilisin